MEEEFNEAYHVSIPSGSCPVTTDYHEMPHADTLNDYLEQPFAEMPGRCKEKDGKEPDPAGKLFTAQNCLRKYWRVIIDGTGLFYFREKHCGELPCDNRHP